MNFRFLRPIIALVCTLAGLALAGPADAATFVVNSTADTTAAGTLRTAINSANSAGGSNTITFDANLFSNGGSIYLSSALPITCDLTITGPGFNKLFLFGPSISGRIFSIQAGCTVTISAMALYNGRARGSNGAAGTSVVGPTAGTAGVGGAIYNGGSLTVREVYFQGNQAEGGIGGSSASSTTFTGAAGGEGLGGAIYSDGPQLKVERCAFTYNKAIGGHGGTGASGIPSSSSNGGTGGAARGGAIWVVSGTVTITNSTFADNVANGGDGGDGGANAGTTRKGGGTGGGAEGGAISAGVAVNVTSCTVAYNEAKPGKGGLDTNNTNRAASGAATGAGLNAGAPMALGNALVALNFSTNPVTNAPASLDVTGPFASLNYNLVGVYDALSASGLGLSADQLGSAASPIDPALDFDNVVDNGGGMNSLRLRRLSPALDRGKNLDSSSFDTRGFSRTVNLDDTRFVQPAGGDGTDIGAFEAQSVPNEPPVATPVLTLTGRVGAPFNGQRLQGSDVDNDTLTYSLAGGELPAGLTLNSDGTVTGTPTDIADVILSFIANDGQVDSAPESVRVLVNEAGSVVVDTTSDSSTNQDGLTSLREAVAFAQVDGESTPVSFDATVFAGPQTITLDPNKATMSVMQDLEVDGTTAGVTIDGNGSRPFSISGGTVAFKDLTFANGSGDANGGGAAVVSGTDVTFTGCTFRNNQSASGNGGALRLFGGNLTFKNCTLSANSAVNGGAIAVEGGALTLLNCTVAGNTANGGSSGGVYVNGGSADAGNSIVFGNLEGMGTAGNLAGTVNSLGYNLLGYSAAVMVTGDTATNLTGVDPGLDPNGLGYNGGPTQTIALTPGSAAIDKGKALGGVTTDQCGNPRVFDSASVTNATGGDGGDIGAFEVPGPGAEIAVALGTTDLKAGTGVIDLGTQEVGSTVQMAFTIRNKGATVLNLSGSPRVVLSGADASQFTLVSQPAAAKLDPGASTTFSVIFAPKSTGLKNAALSIASNDVNENPFVVPLTAVVQDTLTLAPVIVSPRTNGSVYPKATITYQLPENALANSASLTFDGLTDATFPLTGELENAGSHTVVVDTGAVMLPLGIYDLKLSYQDQSGHPAAQAVAANVSIRPKKAVTTSNLAPGVAAPGAGTNGLPMDATLASFGIPAVDDSGGLAYTAKWSASGGLSGSGLFAGSLCLGLVDEDYPDLAGAEYAGFSDPVISDGDVASIASLTGTPAPPASAVLLFLRGQNTPTTKAKLGDVAPDINGNPPMGGGVFAGFRAVSVHYGYVALLASLSGGSGAETVSDANDLGLWMGTTAGPLKLVLREGQMIGTRQVKTITSFATGAGSAGHGRGWLTSPSARGGAVQALVKFTDGSQSVVSVDPTGAATIFANTGVTGAGGPDIANAAAATFAGLGLPAANDADHSVLLAALTVAPGIATSANARGIFLDAGSGKFAPVARVGSLAGLTKARFSVLKDPVLAEDDGLAFAATLAGTTVSGLSTSTLWWQPPGGALTLVAQGGKRPGPDLPATMKWASFPSLAIAEGRGPIFVGNLVVGVGGVTDANATGVWACDFSGAPRLLFRAGTKVAGKTLKKFTLLKATVGNTGVTRSFNNVQQVVWQATFTDGTTAILTTEVP